MNKNQNVRENHFKMLELSKSLTFEDIEDDYNYLVKLIAKYHPDGNFKILEEAGDTKNSTHFKKPIKIKPSMAVVDFAIYLSSKYKNDELRRQAVSIKIFNDYLAVKM